MQTKGVRMSKNTSQAIKSVIAKDCGFKAKKVTNEMPFMANRNLSYFVCMDVIYDLEHKFNVKLPESDFAKYNTVGDLINSVVSELKTRSK